MFPSLWIFYSFSPANKKNTACHSDSLSVAMLTWFFFSLIFGHNGETEGVEEEEDVS